MEVLSIQFNLEPGSTTQPSVTVRRNRSTPVVLPEWRLGQTFRPEDCAVVYAQSTSRGAVRIRVRLRGPAGQTVEVRALGPEWIEQARLGCLLAVFYWLIPFQQWRQYNVLGEVRPFSVAFPQSPAGEKETETEVTVELYGHSLGNMIWMTDTSWRWQFRAGFTPWRDIVTTHHRAYCIPSHPVEPASAPWRQSSDLSDAKLPWLDAIDLACAWAAGSRDRDMTMRAIVRGIWGNGHLLRYDRVGFTSDGLGEPFRLTEFIRHLRTGTSPRSVECYDTSAAVSTFANLLGFSVDQYAMSLPGRAEDVRPVLRIGHTTPVLPAWTEHELARDGANVWDACLQLALETPGRTDLFVPEPVYGMPLSTYRRRITATAAAAGSLATSYRGRRDIV